MIGIRRNVPAEEIFRDMEALDLPGRYHPDFARAGVTRSYVREQEG